MEAKRPGVKKVHRNKKVNGLHVLWIMASSINSRSITLRLVAIAVAGLTVLVLLVGTRWQSVGFAWMILFYVAVPYSAHNRNESAGRILGKSFMGQ